MSCLIFNGIIVLSLILTVTANPLVVKIKSGRILGKISTNYKGGEFYSFMGIPYAKPPIGDLRFKPPLPVDPWKGILNATQAGNQCWQTIFLFKSAIGSEDCLFLNVYTKSTSKSNLKPVMVWIHGGAFIYGSGDDMIYGPDYLLTEDIVLVSINYRLGILGFLSFKDPSLGITGNAGLKDQVLALKWVQENIINFGGDPNNVTVFGQSSGAASVHYLVLSPIPKGLFHKAILQSGSALNLWAQCQHLNKEAWTGMGINSDDPKEVVKLLKKLPINDLYQYVEKLKENWFGSTKRYLGPVVEDPNADQPFLTRQPYEILTSGDYNHVPLIFGFNSMEGLLLGVFKRTAGVSAFSSLNGFEDILASVPHILNYTEGSPEQLLVGERMKQFYLGGRSPAEANDIDLYIMFSDVFFTMDIISGIRHHLKTSKKPIYQYQFTWELSLGFLKDFVGLDAPGVCHGDEAGFFWKSIFSREIIDGSTEDIAIQKMVKMWTNFAKTGNPTPFVRDDIIEAIWEPLNNNEKYLNIGSKFQMETYPKYWQERIHFWKSIYMEHSTLKDYL